jgi:hypothetical protein
MLDTVSHIVAYGSILQACLLTEPFWLWKTNMDPHIIAQINIVSRLWLPKIKNVQLRLLFQLMHVPYILESNPHPFYSFRGLKNQMWITITCGLHLQRRGEFWKNYEAAVRAVRTTQYSNFSFIYYLL